MDYDEHFQERAAIMQYDGGYDRTRAEVLAKHDLRKLYAHINIMFEDDPRAVELANEVYKRNRS